LESLDETPLAPSAELPRLTIVHLLAWMAATALAFFPYQLQMQALERLGSSPSVRVSLPYTAFAALYGVAQGGYLLVAVAILYWRRKGLTERFQPGHWLAFRGACAWLLSTMTWALMFAAGTSFQAMRWTVVPQLMVGAVFFFCFLWLGFRSPEPARWRLLYFVAAASPLLGWLWPMVAVMAGSSPRTPRAFMVGPAISAGVETLVLMAAMWGDVSQGLARHWSHWLGVLVRVVVLAGTLLQYAYYLLSSALRGG
jgi:hypothetical protein